MPKRVLVAGILLFAVNTLAADTYNCKWRQDVTRPWIGPRYWANPMMDWRLRDGRIECHTSGENHDVHLMTYQLGPGDGTLTMTARLSFDPTASGEAFIGFKFAVIGHDPTDYRANLFQNKGIRAGVTAEGRPIIGDDQAPVALEKTVLEDIQLRLKVEYFGGKAACRIEILKGGATDTSPLASFERNLKRSSLRGNLALACEQLESGEKGSATGGFSSWEISGSKVKYYPEQTFGPVLWTQYTLSQKILKLMAHMVPLGENDNRQVLFQVKDADGWRTLTTAQIDPLTRTALFRCEKWDDTRDTPYRVSFEYIGVDGPKTHDWAGMIRSDPYKQDSVSLAVFTGLAGGRGHTFPSRDLTATVFKHDPDILFFSGDQIYESNAGYGTVANSRKGDVPRAMLNYLPKFWIWGWTFRQLLRDRPAILTTDDHDVYSNDLWGRGGVRMTGNRCNGGYRGHPRWVNAAEFVQMGHLPDPVDPAPAKNGINVHFTQVKYGGVSFAVLEDRKFKSAPSEVLTRPVGHERMNDLESIKSNDYDPADLDKPGLTLLGDRQIAFLEQWAADWAGVEFKAVLSGSPFAMCTHGYGDMVADLDSNGWPQSGRNRALRIIRKAHAVTAHGDLHMACLFQNGIDAFRDGPWSYSCPSSRANSLRVWRPKKPGMNREPGEPDYTGDFFDGFGNRMTIRAVLDPDGSFPKTYRKKDGSILDTHLASCSGFGMLRFNKPKLTITFESWPIFDAETPLGDHRQHPGWPRTISVSDNYSRKPFAYLSEIDLAGLCRPALKVMNQETGELVYARRILKAKFAPPVFESGTYTVEILDLDGKRIDGFRNLEPQANKQRLTECKKDGIVQTQVSQ